MNIKREIAVVERRAAAVRMTLNEVVARSGMSRSTVWRAMNGKLTTAAGEVRIVRRLEAAIAEIETASREEIAK